MNPISSRVLGIVLALLCMASAADDVATRLDVEVAPVEDPAPVDDEAPAHDPDAIPREGSAFKTRLLLPRAEATLPRETRGAVWTLAANPPEMRALCSNPQPRRLVMTRLRLPPPATEEPS